MSDNSAYHGHLVPDQVHSMIFPHARLGRRGYDEEHVRAFCAQVEQELTWLLVERASLGQQVYRLRQQIRDAGNGDPATTQRTPASRRSKSCHGHKRPQTIT